jgi:hypothetical protein
MGEIISKALVAKQVCLLVFVLFVFGLTVLCSGGACSHCSEHAGGLGNDGSSLPSSGDWAFL